MMDPLRCKAGAYFALRYLDKQFFASEKGAGFFLFSGPFYCHTFQFHPQFKGQTEVMLGQNRNANRTDEVAGLLMWRHEEDSNIQYMCKHFFFLQFQTPPPKKSQSQDTLGFILRFKCLFFVLFFFYFLKTLSLFFCFAFFDPRL